MNMLHAARLLADPRVAQAKVLLYEALLEHSARLTAVKPAESSLKLSYQEFLEQFAALRSSKLWLPYLGSGLGHGPFVELLDGSVKYDFITGIGVHFFGHSFPDLIAPCLDAAITDIQIQGHLMQNKEGLEVSRLLTTAAGLPHCYLTTSGAMTSENALKLAFHKNPLATRILAFEHCFAGRTLVLAQVTDKPAFREGLPTTINVDYIPYFNAQEPEKSIQEAVACLKKYIARYPQKHAAMIFELVQGEGGLNCGDREFFVALMEVLKENHIAVYVDEVQTFGRTTQLFAFQHFQLQKYIDICTVGKMSLTCATLFSADFAPRPGLLGQTFTSTTVALHCSRVIIENLLKGNYYGPEGKNAKMHSCFVKGLQGIAARHPGILSGPFGIGAMIAFTPFDGEIKKVTQFIHALFEAGVISFICGSAPARVRFLPPVGVLTEQDITTALEIVERTLLTF